MNVVNAYLIFLGVVAIGLTVYGITESNNQVKVSQTSTLCISHAGSWDIKKNVCIREVKP